MTHSVHEHLSNKTVNSQNKAGMLSAYVHLLMYIALFLCMLPFPDATVVHSIQVVEGLLSVALHSSASCDLFFFFRPILPGPRILDANCCRGLCDYAQ